MRFGVLSDVHANLPALRTVLQHLANQGVDGYLCMGDLVGYGPFPNECIEAIATLPAVCVSGNHDLIAIGSLSDGRAGALARETLQWTRSVLEADALTYLRQLPRTLMVEERLVLAHGSLEDPEEYVRSGWRATELLEVAAGGVPGLQALLLGHTHRPWAYGRDSGSLVRRAPAEAKLRPDEAYVLNPGSVGQSRDRSPVARYALLDLAMGSVTYHAVPYDRSIVRAALLAAGLPPSTDHYPPTWTARRQEVTDALRDQVRRRRR